MQQLDQRLIQVVPKEKQIKWQQLEFIAFAHYGMNSFTDKEWGDGKVPTSSYHPKSLDTDDWCKALVDAGAKAMIVTAKHHDGFCLWDTKYTDYSVMHTKCPVDVVEMASVSCKKYGLKFGIYLSPWDIHEPTYGMGKEYDDHFCNQLSELLGNYGDIFEVWFDGACGEGENGKKQFYDWERYYALIKKLQPEAVVAICGEDVRWCGNEAGVCRESEWSVVPASLIDNEKISSDSQKEDTVTFREKGIKSTEEDLGSRERVKNIADLVWFPAEVDTSIRPGWFYHESEDAHVRSLELLKDIYLKSVGGNSVLLLNVPPHKDGYIAPQDKERLRELGHFIKNTFAHSLMDTALVTADGTAKGYDPEVVADNTEEYWLGDDTKDSWELRIDLQEEKSFSYVVLMEQIRCSQRVECFSVEVLRGDSYVEIVKATTVGYKKICKLDNPIMARYIKIKITDARVCPTLKFVGLYK